MSVAIPDHTAVRTALWRALHCEVDAPPILNDTLGLTLAAPGENWRQRPDMNVHGTRGYRAGIVARARLIEDLAVEHSLRGINQYAILGAGLDTFAQRLPAGIDLKIFEIDKPETQAWKRKRPTELGWGVPQHLHLVPVDFEAGESWRLKLASSGFKIDKPALVSSTGVSMYLSRQANVESLREIAALAPGTTVAMTFLLPLDLVDPAERPMHEMVYERARAAGTPFVSFFRPAEILELAREAGFFKVTHISRYELIKRYFAGRADNLTPASGEEFLIAGT